MDAEPDAEGADGDAVPEPLEVQAVSSPAPPTARAPSAARRVRSGPLIGSCSATDLCAGHLRAQQGSAASETLPASRRIRSRPKPSGA